MTGIELLRALARWVDHQPEDLWLQEDGRDPTLTQIATLYHWCQAAGGVSPEDLADHEDDRFRQLWAAWNVSRGPGGV